MSAIASTNASAASGALTRRRRVMSTSSAFSSSFAVATFGSSAMPQSGHVPGPICSISGCIGQV
jgi:hypothetical protein